MKTQDTPNQTNTESQAAIEAAAKAQAAKVAEQRKVERAEYLAYVESDRQTQDLASKLGANVRAMLAYDNGASVKSKVGRPESAQSRRLQNAILASGATFKEIARLYGISIGAIGTNEDTKLSAEDIATAKEKHVTGKGRAEDSKGSVTLRMAKPLAFSIAFGD